MDLQTCVTFDLPFKYKKLLLYPIAVRDYTTLSSAVQCLKTDKNSIPGGKFITMSELEYLYYASRLEDGVPYILHFDRLLSLVLKDDSSFSNIPESIRRYKYNDNNKPIFIIEGEEYNHKDFAEIKKIIVEQNDIEVPDTNISKEVRDSLEKAREYKRRLSKEKPASLEDYIISIAVATGWEMEYIYSMPIRKFQKTISRLDNYIHYKIYLAASMSGMVEFKDKSFIKHWLSNLDTKDKYSDVSVDLDALQNKISLESAK